MFEGQLHLRKLSHHIQKNIKQIKNIVQTCETPTTRLRFMRKGLQLNLLFIACFSDGTPLTGTSNVPIHPVSPAVMITVASFSEVGITNFVKTL